MSGQSAAESADLSARVWLGGRWERLNGPRRLAGIDLARGLAVLGMFAAHLLVIEDPFDWSEPGSWIAVVDGRSSILFATLAGMSIGLVTGGAVPVRGSALAIARGRLAVRAALLWVLGILLILTTVPVYVILPAYALLFLLALPFVVLRATALFVLAAILAIAMPFVQVLLDALPVWQTRGGGELALVLGWHYPFTTWIAFVLAGLAAARAGVTRRGVPWWLLGVGAALAAIGYGADAALGTPERAEAESFAGALWTARAHSTGLLEVVGSGGFALAVIGLCLLLCRTPIVWAVLPLRAVGSMPLTTYTLQLVAWAIVAASVLERVGDLSGFRALDPFWPLTLATTVFCTAWALLVGRGPLEEVVDRLSRAAVRRRR